jgi:hypothetical protein
MENCPFIDDLPLKNGHFPWSFSISMLVYCRVNGQYLQSLIVTPQKDAEKYYVLIVP